MWPTRDKKIREIDRKLQEFSKRQLKLAGIAEGADRKALVMQIIASLRRLDYTQAVKSRDISARRADPSSNLFDPERAAVFFARTGQVDEAIWLIFLATHFGQHGHHKWRMLRDVYSGLGSGTWTWARASANPNFFGVWLQENVQNIRGAFGNHRKYETLKPASKNGTAIVIESFIQCFAPSPSRWFASLVRAVGNDPHKLFEESYNQLAIARFGRLAKFDFLALLGRLDLAPISPGSAYLNGATGPLRGARLLVDGNPNSTTRAVYLDEVLQKLDQHLHVGMQVMEDSICNWQKSPHQFVHFRG
jgi:Alpha-glutamyl/putrescinyl thymine pyrophosphorylase clade 3